MSIQSPISNKTYRFNNYLLGTLVYTAREPLKQDFTRHVSRSISCRHGCTVLFGGPPVGRTVTVPTKNSYKKYLCLS